MKKIISLGIIFLFGIGISFGEGCFHDAIQTVDKPGIVTQGARIRNLACMDGSQVITTLKVGTKVRIIGQTAWTKIVLPDGKIGRIGNAFIKESFDWTDVPNLPNNHTINSYCDTLDVQRCPNPSKPGEIPTFYTENPSQPTSTTTTNNTSTNSIMDNLLDQFFTKLETKYGNNISKRNQVITATIGALRSLQKRNPKLKNLIDDLIINLQESIIEISE